MSQSQNDPKWVLFNHSGIGTCRTCPVLCDGNSTFATRQPSSIQQHEVRRLRIAPNQQGNLPREDTRKNPSYLGSKEAMLNLQNFTFSASVIKLERGTAVKSHHVQLVCPVENGGFHFHRAATKYQPHLLLPLCIGFLPPGRLRPREWDGHYRHNFRLNCLKFLGV